VALENNKQRIKREALEALPVIVQSMNVEPGYTYVSREVLDWLIKNELAIGNEAIVNEGGAIATRATEKGVEKVMSETNEVAAAPVKAKPTFAILNVEIPAEAARKAGGRRGGKYPFDNLEVGASFFVPVSEEVPEPAKTMAASIANANARFATPVSEEDGSTKMRTRKKKDGTTEQVAVTQFTKVFAGTPYTLDDVAGVLVFRKK
jgi:hypothetical protein